MKLKTLFLAAVTAFAFAFTSLANAGAGVAVSTVGLSGYDPVSYFTHKRPVRGAGDFAVEHNGVTYLFATEASQATFKKNPEKYLPQYGGYCAFGVANGKKFFGDPEVWRVVDGKLYLNLNANVQDLWFKDVPGNIKEANKLWGDIKDKPAAEL